MLSLGITLGHAATKTEVKYNGPNQITVSEDKDESIILPGLGSPSFEPSFFHQGSNFFFNPKIVMPIGGIETGPERVIAPFQPIQEVICDPESKLEEVIENVEFIIPERPSIVIPQIEIEEIQTIQQGQIEIDRIPIEVPLPAFPIQVVREEPCVDIQIDNIVPNVPILIEEPVQPTGGLFISEVDVRVNKIPPPPELPPLILSEIPRPLIVQENKKVILIPAAPELTMFHPPSIMVENPLFPTDCAQNIVFERILPNLAFEYGKTLELISIPATKRAPVVSSIIF